MVFTVMVAAILNLNIQDGGRRCYGEYWPLASREIFDDIFPKCSGGDKKRRSKSERKKGRREVKE